MARSDWPSVLGWAGVFILRLVPALANKACQKSLVKRGSLSLMMASGKP